MARAKAEKPYHHGELREALVAAGRKLLEEKGLRVGIRLETANAIAVFDPHRVVQVLVNLFSNAIKFSPAGGLIQWTKSP